MAFTAEDKLREVRRELALRAKHYPRWIGMGTLDASAAARQIALMEAIAEDYEAQVAQGDLFPKTQNGGQ